MHECSAARDATPPIQAMQAGPPGPTFAGHRAKSERACRSIPARNLFCVPGVHLNPSHTRVVHMCWCASCCRPCLLGSWQYLSAYRCPSLRCLYFPSIAALVFTLSRLLAVFSETLAAFRHSLAMTSPPIPPAGHYAIEPLLVSSARSRYAHWRSTRQPQSAWQAPVPWAANRRRARDSLRLVVCALQAAPQHASNSARLLLSRMLDVSVSICARPSPPPSWGILSCLIFPPWSGIEANGLPHTLNRTAMR